jgi:hypothetical protein
VKGKGAIHSKLQLPLEGGYNAVKSPVFGALWGHAESGDPISLVAAEIQSWTKPPASVLATPTLIQGVCHCGKIAKDQVISDA